MTRVERRTRRRDLPGDDCLVVVSAPNPTDLGKVYVLGVVATTIGSSLDNDIVLDGDGVSPRHVELFRPDARLFAIACDSAHGTFLNDELEPVTSSQLRNGDRLEVGGVVFEYLLGPDAEAQYRKTVGTLTIADDEGVSSDPTPSTPEPRERFRHFLQGAGRFGVHLLWCGAVAPASAALLYSFGASEPTATVLTVASPVLLLGWSMLLVRWGPDSLVPVLVRFPPRRRAYFHQLTAALLVGFMLSVCIGYVLAFAILPSESAKFLAPQPGDERDPMF